MLSFSYHLKIYHFLIYRSNPSGSITSHKWFTSLKAKVELGPHVFLERALSLRSSSINTFLGGPQRVFCQLHAFAYLRRVILHKGFVDARLQRPRESTFGQATGLIHLDRLHPIKGLLPCKQRLSSGLTSLRACFKFEIVVYKFLCGSARRVFCQLDFSAYPRRVILHKVFVDERLQRPRGSTSGRATGKIIAYKVFKKYRREASQFPVCLKRFHP